MMPAEEESAMPVSIGAVLEAGFVEIHTTFESRQEAAACAERLVAGRLAACVQLDGPVTSTYRWQAAVETAEEWRCSCKTTLGRRDACIEAILAGHPYQTPQLTVVPVAATAAYAAWVRDSVEAL
jgi:periplasmic divalent cation tolerance protein